MILRLQPRVKGYHIFPRSDSREQNANAERKPGVGPATQSRGAGYQKAESLSSGEVT